MNFFLYILICVFLMFGLLFLRRKRYCLSGKRVIMLAPATMIMGFLGTYLMYFIENGAIGGVSFFGAVLFFLPLLLPVSLLFKIHILDLLDFATPAGVLLLVVSKYNCYLAGCCEGKVIAYHDGIPEFFPSQLAEMGAALVITLILLLLEMLPIMKRKVYPVCLVLYGSVRYILNQFRWESEEFAFGMTAGSFWSLVAIAYGSVWLIVVVVKFYTHQRRVLHAPN